MWIVDPVAHIIEVFRHSDAGYVRHTAISGREPARIPPFDAVELPIAEWWADSEE